MTIVEAAKTARGELMKEAKAHEYNTVVGIRLIKKQGAENLYLSP